MMLTARTSGFSMSCSLVGSEVEVNGITVLRHGVCNSGSSFTVE